MDKILAINTIKNVFSALGAKTSDSNYAVALLDKTSAEPKGMMDFANLASVLGGIPLVPPVDMTAETLNTKAPGGYRVGSDISPFGIAGIIYVLQRSSMISQLFISFNASTHLIGHRFTANPSNDYGGWYKVEMAAL